MATTSLTTELAAMNSSSSVKPAALLLSTNNDDFRDYFVLLLYLLTALVAMVGNLFVCWVIYKNPKLRSTTYYLLFNMAISDFLAGLVIPAQWLFCHYHLMRHLEPLARVCALAKTTQVLSYYLSTYSMLFVAIDRFLLVRFPSSHGLQRKWVPIALSWLAGLAFSTTTLVNIRIAEYFGPQSVISCRIVFQTDVSLTFRKIRILILLLSQYLLPLITICILYFFVWRTIQERDVVGTRSEANVKKVSASKRKLIKMLVIVVAGFAFAWLPVHLIHFINFYVYPLLPKACNASTFYNFTYWLGITSCCYNPFIYYWGNPEFRTAFTTIRAKLSGACQLSRPIVTVFVIANDLRMCHSVISLPRRSDRNACKLTRHSF
jgi:hypothetical protein